MDTLCEACRQADTSCQVYPQRTLTCVEFRARPALRKDAELSVCRAWSATPEDDRTQSMALFESLVRIIRQGAEVSARA